MLNGASGQSFVLDYMMTSDRYLLTEKNFSAGSHGSIDLYRDVELGRTVAVKSLHTTADNDRLQDEITALGSVQSNNVVQVYDVIIERRDAVTELFLVQEFIEGKELTEFANPYTTLKEVLFLLYQLASALCDIHEAGITHRDVKPQNIKIDAEGVLKLFDFGLARFAARQSTVGIRGTVGYMAPELRTLGYVNFTTAVDVFAFGATARCLLHENLEIEPEPELSGYTFSEFGLSQLLEDTLASSLAIDPAKRPSAQAMRDALGRDLSSERHRAQLVTPTQVAALDAKVKSAQLKSATGTSCNISYDGFDFFVEPISGAIFRNNIKISAKEKIVGSCLITLGESNSGAGRVFIPFDVSHPEVSG